MLLIVLVSPQCLGTWAASKTAVTRPPCQAPARPPTNWPSRTVSASAGSRDTRWDLKLKRSSALCFKLNWSFLKEKGFNTSKIKEEKRLKYRLCVFFFLGPILLSSDVSSHWIKTCPFNWPCHLKNELKLAFAIVKLLCKSYPFTGSFRTVIAMMPSAVYSLFIQPSKFLLQTNHWMTNHHSNQGWQMEINGY